MCATDHCRKEDIVTCKHYINVCRDFYLFFLIDKEDVAEAPAQQQVKDNKVRKIETQSVQQTTNVVLSAVRAAFTEG